MRTEKPKRRFSTVGLVLKEHRKLHGLTQEQAAHYLGIEPRTLRMYENGERIVENVRELRRMASLLGIDPRRFGLATLTIESCSVEQIDEAIQNSWSLVAQSRFVEARTMIEAILQDLHFQPLTDHQLLRTLANAHHIAGHVVAITSRTNEVMQAIKHFQDMEEIARYIEDDSLINIALTYQGDMYRRRGDLNKAISCLETACYATPRADTSSKGNCAQLLARSYLQRRDNEGFRRSLGNSESIASELGLTGNKMSGAFSLGTVYEEYARGFTVLGDTKRSLEYIEKAREALPPVKRWEMVLMATQAEALARGNDLHEGVKLAATVASFARLQNHNRLLERIYLLHNYLDHKAWEIGQANMLLREALVGPIELRP